MGNRHLYRINATLLIFTHALYNPSVYITFISHIDVKTIFKNDGILKRKYSWQQLKMARCDKEQGIDKWII